MHSRHGLLRRHLFALLLCASGALSACTTAATNAQPESANSNLGGLNIALTNDDGWDAPGIVQLARVLRERGHRVIAVGSATQQSGSAAALNGEPVMVRMEAVDSYSVSLAAPGEGASTTGAEPLTCGMLAMDIATQLGGRGPDLLVSGINSGANIGGAAMHSGTVGAVIGALSRAVNNQVAGIAISTDQPKCDAPCVNAHYTQVANYIADLIQRLQQQQAQAAASAPTSAPGPLLEAGLGLNVNYPGIPATQIQGVRVTNQDPGFGGGGQRIRLQLRCPNCATLEIGASTLSAGLNVDADPGSVDPDSDVTLFNQGYITIVPITPDLTAQQWQSYGARLQETWQPTNPTGTN